MVKIKPNTTCMQEMFIYGSYKTNLMREFAPSVTCLSRSPLLSEQSRICVLVNKHTSIVFWMSPGVWHLPPFLALIPVLLTNFFVPTPKRMLGSWPGVGQGDTWSPLELIGALWGLQPFTSNTCHATSIRSRDVT